MATSPEFYPDMSSVYSARAVANFFLESGWAEDVPVDPMKLQKLVYIAHGWCLALLGRQLIVEEVQAWEHGPVVPDLYHQFKHFRGDPIDHHARGEHGGRPSIAEWDAETLTLLGKVWRQYGRSTGSALRRLTHEPGSPWDWVDKACGGQIPRGMKIPNEVIRDHYRSLVPMSGGWLSPSKENLIALGAVSTLDLSGQSLNRLLGPRKDRSDGLRRDGLKVAGDIRRAFEAEKGGA